MKRPALVTLFKNDASAEVARLRDPSLPAPKERLALVGKQSQRLLRRLRKYSLLLLIVGLPTLLTSIYFFFWAADQYVSEARFVVRGQSSVMAPSLIGAMMGGGGGGLHASQDDLESVNDFIVSHDAVRGLQKKLDLVDMFRRPEADLLSRLWRAQPSAEELLKYYQSKVSVDFDTGTGISTLRVRAYRPTDAQEIARILLTLSEGLVNQFSERSQADSLRVARQEVERAEARVVAAREEITTFRSRDKSIDPGKSSTVVFELIGRLEGQLAQARADITEAQTYLKADNSKLQMLTNKASALEAQITSEKRRLTGSDGALVPAIAAYERLLLEREFADKGYSSALMSLENARIEAGKQHLYLIRIVEPNLPEEALYPKRIIVVMTVFFCALMAYAIGWLILAGVREHAA